MWLTVDELGANDVPPESDIRTRMSDALYAATELIDAYTNTSWADEEVLPNVIREAGLLQAGRLFKRQSATFGIATVGTVDGGQGMRLLAKLDPDVELLLSPYPRSYAGL
jgi:hypothetical protein